MQVSSPTCFESRGGAPKPVIVKISSKEPADVIPQIGFNACYKDVVGSPDKCLAFAIIQSCAASANVAYGTTDATGGATTSGASGTMVGTGQSYGAATQTQGSQGAAQAQSYGQSSGQSYGAATQTQGSQAASQTSRAAAGMLSFPFCTTVRVIRLLQPHVRAFTQCEYPMGDRWCLHHKSSVMEMLCGRTDILYFVSCSIQDRWTRKRQDHAEPGPGTQASGMREQT
jgi:hypothetical protein